MKKTYLFILLSLLSINELNAEGFKKRNLLEVRAGYFFFSNGNARKIYDNGTPALEIENNYWFTDNTTVWANFDFNWKSGFSMTFFEPADIYLPTLSAGLKRYFPIKLKNILPYLGAGLSAAIPYEHSTSNYLPHNTVRFAPGITFKSGCIFLHDSNFAFDLFFDYYLQGTYEEINSSFWNSIIDIGGFRTGVGAGYMF